MNVDDYDPVTSYDVSCADVASDTARVIVEALNETNRLLAIIATALRG